MTDASCAASTPFELPESAVAAAVTRLLESPVRAVKRVAGSVENQDFVVRTNTGDYVLKVGDGQRFVVEAWACGFAAGLGVLAPEIVAVQPDGSAMLPLPFILMRHLPGSPLEPDADTARAVGEAGAQLRRVHGTRLDGYGRLRHDPARQDPPAGTHQTWPDFLAEPLGYLDELVAHDVLGRSLADRLRAALTKTDLPQAYDGPGLLLHGDLHARHLFAERDELTGVPELTGIIDWGDALAGDPLYDVALFAVEDGRLVTELLDGYGLRLTPDATTLMTFYRIVRTTLVLHHEFRSGGDWFAAYRSRLESDLGQLTSTATAR